MKASERIAVIRRSAAEIAALSESDADWVLDIAGAASTPSGFDRLDSDKRIGVLYDLLAGQDESVLRSLASATFAPEDSWAFRVANHLVGLPPMEMSFLLRQVGIDDVANDPYFPHAPIDVQRRVILQMMVGNEQVIDDLYEALRDEIGGDAPPPADPLQAADPPSVQPLTPSSLDDGGPIFVVHGHDRAVLHELVRVLERGTGREVVVLHEQANNGAVLLEKFEGHAARAAYAVVLVTADDVGGPVAGAEQQPRGRQNVVFELGYFFGKLGRERVTVLLEPGVEEPSDIKGLVYTALDPGGSWKRELGRELRSAKLPFDDARVP
jgi:predicted nucleotide-binding protein